MGIFIFLFFASAVLLIVGLIKPTFVFRWLPDKFQTRKYAGIILGSLTLLSFVLGGITTPRPNESLQNEIESVAVSEQKTQGVDARFLVTRVIDGDTIEIEGGQRVRYLGIDTPETVDPRKPVQCFGREASEKNKSLVAGQRVRLEKDITDADRYGRLLRYVYVNDVLVNLKLISEGFAFSYTYPPDVKYQAQFTEAERAAREQKKGLWGSCPITTGSDQSVTPAPVAPSPTAPSTQTAPEQNSCQIKGNISSRGEKIYHVSGCGSYSKTVIDESKGERWFCSESEATSAGWRKALNCP